MIKAIIFDMDGTMVDTEPFHTLIEKNQFRDNHIELSDEEHKKFMGTSSDIMWTNIAEKYQLQTPVAELIKQNRDECLRFFTEVDEIPVMPGLTKLLDKFYSEKFPMAVASSSFPEIIDLILERTGLKPYFQVIVSAEEAGKSKPEPDIFLLAAQKLGISPDNCLVVEDSDNGIKAAHAAGMSCLVYLAPNSDASKTKDADAIIRDYAQLGMFFVK